MLGVPLAWVLARVRLPGLALIRAIVTLPLVLPPVVGGIALLLALGRSGIVGRYLDQWFGITLPFTTAGVVVAETFVAMPFLVVTVEGALRSADRDLEEAAVTLGASRVTVFGRVTLPTIAPSLLAGSILCWARALGEFGATITFAGNFPGTTQTMPLEIYTEFEQDPPRRVALSLVLLLVAVRCSPLLRDRWLRGRRPDVDSASKRPGPDCAWRRCGRPRHLPPRRRLRRAAGRGARRARAERRGQDHPAAGAGRADTR